MSVVTWLLLLNMLSFHMMVKGRDGLYIQRNVGRNMPMWYSRDHKFPKGGTSWKSCKVKNVGVLA